MTSSRTPMAGPDRRSNRPRSRPLALVVGTAALAVVLLIAVAMLGGNRRGASPEPSGATSGGGSAAAAGSPSAHPAPGHEVYGFVPYWEMDGTIVDHIAATKFTTVALFSVTHTGKGSLAMNANGARRIDGPIGRAIIARAHADGRRADLAYTSFGRQKNATLFGSRNLQDVVISSLVHARADLGVDGVAVDVEQIDDADIPAYGAFVGRLRGALRADHPGATVTVTTTAGQQGAALALAATLAGADRVFLMGYDYRTGSSQPGATSPLSRLDGDQRTLSWSLDLYAAIGVPPERTLLGLPLYGVAWPVASADLGAAATGKGDVWVPRQNLATLRDRTLKPSYDPVEAVEFVALPTGKTWQAIYYDTPESLTPKLALADDRGLAGAGLWAVGYERGLPGYEELISSFRAGRLVAPQPVLTAP